MSCHGTFSFINRNNFPEDFLLLVMRKKKLSVATLANTTLTLSTWEQAVPGDQTAQQISDIQGLIFARYLESDTKK